MCNCIYDNPCYWIIALNTNKLKIFYFCGVVFIEIIHVYTYSINTAYVNIFLCKSTFTVSYKVM